jgi:tetratricopeptide (TPR) repeat protein
MWSLIKAQKRPLIFLSALVIFCYANSLNNEFISDDIFAIRDNPAIKSPAYFLDNRLFSLRPLELFLIHKFFGPNPAFFRLPNILAHIGAVCFAYLTLQGLYGRAAAFFAAAIFACHPVMAEAVTWISGGAYAHYSFLFLASFYFYLRAGARRRAYFLSLAFFILALLFTERAAVFIFIFLVWELVNRTLGRNWKRLLPFFVLGGGWLLFYILRIKVQQGILASQYCAETGTENIFYQVPIAISSYLELLFWPADLTLYHSELSFMLPEYIFRLAIFIVFMLFIVWGYWHNPKVFFWLSLFLIALSPTLTPFRISWVVAERYVYLGALGVFTLVGLGLARLAGHKKYRRAVYAGFGVILLVLSARTICRNIDWKNQDNLWFSTGRHSPSCPTTHNNLGDVWTRRGDLNKAAEEFQLAIKLKPNYADAYHNLANTYWAMGRIDEAIAGYQEALEFNPNIWQAYQRLAIIHYNLGNRGLAEQYLRAAINIDPKNEELRSNLSAISPSK